MIRLGIYFVKRSVASENGDIRVSKLCVAGKHGGRVTTNLILKNRNIIHL